MTLQQRQADFLARCDRVTAALDNDDAADPVVRDFITVVVAYFGLAVAMNSVNPTPVPPGPSLT